MSLWIRDLQLPWPTARIRDCASIINGWPLDSTRFNDSVGMPVVRIRDLLRGWTDTYYDGNDFPASTVVRDGDLVIGMDGDFNSSTWRGLAGVLNQRLCILRSKPLVDPRFLAYFINIPLRAIHATTFSTTVKHLSSQDLGHERMPIPPLPDQQRISDFLDDETSRIDELWRAKRRMLDLLSERRMSVLLQHLSGLTGMVPPVPTRQLAWLRQRPGHWREAKLSLIGKLGSGHTPSRSRPEWWEDADIPWITTGEVTLIRDDRTEQIRSTRERISKAGLANSSALVHPAGTVVLSRTASAGFSAIMGLDMATSQDFATWTCGPLLRPRFLLLCLRAMRADLLGRLAMGSTHKTIYMPDIESLRVPLPPVEEQDLIVENVWYCIRPLDEAWDSLVAQIDLLRERRHALITAAVTGELEVA